MLRHLLATVALFASVTTAVAADLTISADGYTATVNGNSITMTLDDSIRDMPRSVKFLRFDLPNYGGDLVTAVQAGKIVRERGITVYVKQECDSACTYILQSSFNRVSSATAKFIVHAGNFKSENSRSHEIEFMNNHYNLLVSWGMNPSFADKYIRHQNGNAVLTASEALQVGLITQIVNN